MSRGRGCGVSLSPRNGRCRRALPAGACSPATCVVPASVAADRAGARRDRDRGRGHRCGGDAHHHFCPNSRCPGLIEPERRASDRGVHGAGRQPRARGLRDPEWIEQAAVRNHHVVLRHRLPDVLARPGRRGSRLSGLPAGSPSRGRGCRPGVHGAAACDRLGDFQLHRRWSRRELGDPRRRAGGGRAVHRDQRRRTCPPWGSRRCAVRQRSPPARV